MKMLKRSQTDRHRNSWLRQQYLLRRDHCQGFTLIELLVTIIVVGILSAIALPSFISRVQQTKEAEARTYVASVSKGQQTYYMEYGRFSPNVENLEIGIPTITQHYSYQTEEDNDPVTGTLVALTEATQIDAQLRSFSGQVWIGVLGNNGLTTSVFCEGATGAAPPRIVNHQCQ